MAVAHDDYDKPEWVKTVLTDLPAGVDCDFRDPKVWYEEADATFYMILGASVNGDPAMLLFTLRIVNAGRSIMCCMSLPAIFAKTAVAASNARISSAWMAYGY